jgi:flagellar hook-associated protein 3 FlgL
MIVRVTDSLAFQQVTDSLGRIARRLLAAQEQAATGRRINRPSDDPPGAAQVVQAQTALVTLAQDRRAVALGRTYLGAQDGVLSDATNLLARAREIATQHANGLSTPADRAAAAAEVHALLEAMAALGNTEFEGRRLYGGAAQATGVPPFTDPNDPAFDPDAPYAGSATPFTIEIGSGEELRVTTPGDQVFGGAIAALADLEDRLRTGADPAPALTTLGDAAGDLAAEQASVGARLQRLDQQATRIRTLDLASERRLAAVRDADVVAAVSALTQLQIALQTSASAASSILQGSLAGLLRV